MGKQGKRVSEPIRGFIIDCGRNAPSLSNREIADKVQAKYGEGAKVDKSTVGRIRRSAKRERSNTKASAANSEVRALGFDLRDHRQLLVTALNDLKGVDPFSLHDQDLVTWWSRPQEPSWPVPRGRAWRNQDGSLEVRLDVESRREWIYLRQHLQGRKVWEAIEDCKKALAGDLAARLTLMDSIAARIQDAPDRGGLGLPIEADLGFILVTRSEVTIYYVFTIHAQVLSRALALPHAPKRREEFDYRDPGYPEVVSLGGLPVVRSTDTEVRSRAVSFLLEAQEQLAWFPEHRAAAEAYRAAEASAKGANNEIVDVLLMPGFPPGSACDLCAGLMT